MPTLLETEAAVQAALERVQQYLQEETERAAGESSAADGLLYQTAVLLIQDLLRTPSTQEKLVRILLTTQLGASAEPVEQQVVETVDEHQLSISVRLDGSNLLVTKSFPTTSSQEVSLALSSTHLALLRLFLEQPDQKLSITQIIAQGIASKKGGAVQLMQSINVELHNHEPQLARSIYIEPIGSEVFQLRLTNLGHSAKFFEHFGFTGSFGEYYLTPAGVFKNDARGIQSDKLKLKLGGRRSQVFGTLVTYHRSRDLSIEEIAEILHVSYGSVLSVFNELQRLVHGLGGIPDWEIKVNSIDQDGRTKKYRLARKKI